MVLLKFDSRLAGTHSDSSDSFYLPAAWQTAPTCLVEWKEECECDLTDGRKERVDRIGDWSDTNRWAFAESPGMRQTIPGWSESQRKKE